MTTQMDWPTLEISSFDDFQKIIESLPGMDVELPYWSFRGQSNSEWTLQTSLSRILTRNKIKEEEHAFKIEMTLSRYFHSNHHHYPELNKIEFTESNVVLMWMLMQHYGSPTRLLDWTDSPFIALYYAAESTFDKDGAVFLFNNHILQEESEKLYGKIDPAKLTHPTKDKSITVALPMINSKRSYHQQAVFTLSTSLLHDHGEMIHNFLKDKVTKEKCAHLKLAIKKEVKIDILAKLRKFNIRPDILYPDAYGLGREIQNLAELKSHRFTSVSGKK